MFEFIGNILENIANFFTSIWDFILNLVNEIVYIVGLLSSIILTIPSYFTWLPASVLIGFTALIGLVVVYKVMGREG